MVSSSLAAAFAPGYGVYTASKAAVETMTTILAKELKGTGITASCGATGPIATELFFEGKSEEMIQKVIDASPLCRLGETKDIAPVVGFLCGDDAEGKLLGFFGDFNLLHLAIAGCNFGILQRWKWNRI